MQISLQLTRLLGLLLRLHFQVHVYYTYWFILSTYPIIIFAQTVPNFYGKELFNLKKKQKRRNNGKAREGSCVLNQPHLHVHVFGTSPPTYDYLFSGKFITQHTADSGKLPQVDDAVFVQVENIEFSSVLSNHLRREVELGQFLSSLLCACLIYYGLSWLLGSTCSVRLIVSDVTAWTRAANWPDVELSLLHDVIT